MEYTNDMILGGKYSKDKKRESVKFKQKILKIIIKKICDDELFTLSIFVSMIVLIVDFLCVKHFIEILKIL